VIDDVDRRRALDEDERERRRLLARIERENQGGASAEED